MVRILIADDHAAVRRSIRSVVESHPGWTLCGEATNGREAVEQTRRLKPDVVLLDMMMPELNGLEATRQIVREAPDTQVLLLTMHESNELVDEALRAGAQGVVLKSSADGALTKAIESLSRFAIHLAGKIVGKARHIGAFFRSKAEQLEVLAPFVKEGLKRGEKFLNIIDPSNRDTHSRQLREAGVDVDRATAQGHMELIPWDELQLRDGRFDKDAMLVDIQQLLRDRVEQGFQLGRWVAHMEWALQDRPGVGDLAEFEASVNDVLPQYDYVVICAYDLSRFPASTIVDVIRGHPAVIIGAMLYDNPFYTPPDQLVEEFRQRGHA
jgi:DNA-binding NarL/FixJ family response regulator